MRCSVWSVVLEEKCTRVGENLKEKLGETVNVSNVTRKKGLKFEQMRVRNPCRKSGDLLFFTVTRRGASNSFLYELGKRKNLET